MKRNYLQITNTKTINQYQNKKLTVADFVNHTDGKVVFLIIDNNDVELYEGRQEYLAWTEEGMADIVCDKVVDYFDIGKDGQLMLYLEKEGE